MNFFKKTVRIILVAIFILFSSALLFHYNTANAACINPVLNQVGSPTNHPNKVDYHFSIKNCAASPTARKYKLTADLPTANWKIDFSGTNVSNADVVTVGKDATVKFDATITPPNNATPKTYNNISVTAAGNDGKGGRDSVSNIKYTVDANNPPPGGGNACNNPTLKPNGHDGNVYHFKIDSNCNNDKKYNLSVDLPGGNNTKWHANFSGPKVNNNDVISVSGGTTPLFDVKITHPSTATGTHQIPLFAKEVGKPAKKDKATIAYTISGSCSDNNPHYTCGTNNTCTTVNTCGKNSGGCTTGSGACGTTDGTKLNFVIGLDTIGTTGTGKVPVFVGPFTDPQHPSRTLKIEIYKVSDTSADPETETTSIEYDSVTTSPTYTKFIGNVSLPDDFVTGNYIVKVTTDGHLTKQVPGVLNIVQNQNNTVPSLNLIAGDVDNNNILDIKDYGLLISCSIFAKTPEAQAACNADPSYKLNSDLNDDGADAQTPNVDQFDYIYFIQEFSIQSGD